MNPAIMATRATSFTYEVETLLEFQPNHYSQTAGLGLYYDSNNWLYAHVTYSEEKRCPYLTLLQAKLGQRIEYVNTRRRSRRKYSAENWIRPRDRKRLLSIRGTRDLASFAPRSVSGLLI